MSNRATTKAVILARGLGTRMRKSDQNVALDAAQSQAADSGVKALVRIKRPFLDYVLHVLAESGYTDVCLVIGPEHTQLRDYYTREAVPRRIKVSFAIQEKPQGTADAVRSAETFAAGERFLVLNSDNFYPQTACAGLRTLTTAGLAGFDRQAMIQGSNIPEERIVKFAAIQVTPDGYLKRVIEKPDAATLASLGEPILLSMNCWMFSPAIFQACRLIGLSPRGEYEIPDAVQYAIEHLHEPFRVLHFAAPVLDLSCRSDIPAVVSKLGAMEIDP